MYNFSFLDLFCGAGGSSAGGVLIPGLSVRAAGNHWDRAIETHSINHPEAKHICADVSQIDPAAFPNTDLGWFSPSCTKHSVAQGKKRLDKIPDRNGETLPDAAAERSRATMWDVVRFTEFHAYQAVIVENVVEVYFWPPFQAWLGAMQSLGYDHEIVWLNSMHAHVFGAGAPQSRDRIYIVFWRQGARRPDLELANRPVAVCPTCGPIRALKVWKKADSAHWGRYRTQYYFQCPTRSCRARVEPVYRPALEIINWDNVGQRIGDRERPLRPKTMTRIRAGIERYWGPLAVPVEGRDGKMAQPVAGPIRTMTTRNETGLAIPHSFIGELRGGSCDARSIDQPLSTVVASGFHHALVSTFNGRNSRGAQPVTHALPTVTTHDRCALLMRNNTGGPEMSTPVTEPIRTITTGGHQSLLTAPTEAPVDINDVWFRMLEPSESKRAMDFADKYVITGSKREQQRLAGNAVTPPVSRDLFGLVVAALDPSMMPEVMSPTILLDAAA